MQSFEFIFLNCDEITTMNNQIWLCMHVYVTKLLEDAPHFVEFVEGD
jgi:hypothetical protein